MRKKELQIELILILMLVVISVINVVSISLISVTLSQKSAEAKELARPASLEVTKIIYPGCDGCYNIDDLLTAIKQTNAKIIKEETISMADAEDLISKHGIAKLPAAIVSGEIEKNSDVLSALAQYGEKKGDVVVLNKFDPPYYDLSENRIVGKVDAVVLSDSSCTKCTNMSALLDALGESVVFSSQKNVDYSSAEGKEIIAKFGIKSVPSIIVSEDITRYESIAGFWLQLGAEAKDSSFVIPPATPPYVNLASGKTVGLVSVVYITDSSCSTCYNVSLHKTILERSFGVAVVNETSYNTTTGKGLISKYNITKVPTIVLSPDASYYAQMAEVWKGVGTTEKDGWLVFRSTEQMGAYKDLTTGNVVGTQ